MTPVITRTNSERPKMDLAGVEAGAKMFVGLEKVSGSAKTLGVTQTKVTSTFSQRRSAGMFRLFCMSNFSPRSVNTEPSFMLHPHENTTSLPRGGRLGFGLGRATPPANLF